MAWQGEVPHFLLTTPKFTNLVPKGLFEQTQLVTSGKLAKSAIIGLSGGVWATSSGYEVRSHSPSLVVYSIALSLPIQLSTKEQKDIVDAFANLDKLRAEGLHIGGKKFVTMTADDQQIHVRQRGVSYSRVVVSATTLTCHFDLQGTDGLLIVKTKLAVLVAEYVAPIQAGEAMTVVGSVADYFIGLNY